MAFTRCARPMAGPDNMSLLDVEVFIQACFDVLSCLLPVYVQREASAVYTAHDRLLRPTDGLTFLLVQEAHGCGLETGWSEARGAAIRKVRSSCAVRYKCVQFEVWCRSNPWKISDR